MYKFISFSSVQILSLSCVMLVSWSGSHPVSVILKDGIEKCKWRENGSKLHYFCETVWLEW